MDKRQREEEERERGRGRGRERRKSFSQFLSWMNLILQPENILLYRKGSLDIKIADFGLSVQVQKGQEMKTLVGTAEYVCKSQHPYIIVTITIPYVDTAWHPSWMAIIHTCAFIGVHTAGGGGGIWISPPPLQNHGFCSILRTSLTSSEFWFPCVQSPRLGFCTKHC